MSSPCLSGSCTDAEPPFHCDYGWHITLGERAFLNFGCVVLDCAAVEIGAFAKLAPCRVLRPI